MTKFLGTSKRVFTEETVSKQSFIIPNWRPLDTVYWVAQRSIRKSSMGNQLQNGFMFYENALGYNFKSIDSMIDDINNQKDSPTNLSTDQKKMYRYTYAPKALNEELDHLTLGVKETS